MEDFTFLFFWIFAIGTLFFGVSVIVCRNPVGSALSLVMSMVFLALLFFQLEAYFLATIQILVYAGAVMVLFLFIIMLLDLKEEPKRQRSLLGYFFGLAMAFFLGVVFFLVIGGMPEANIPVSALAPVPDNELSRIGGLLFNRYILPFEIVGVLLLIGTIGVVLLSQSKAGGDSSGEGGSA